MYAYRSSGSQRNRTDKRKSDGRRRSITTEIESSVSSDVISVGSSVTVVSRFEIRFDRESARFYEGENVGGTVVLDLKDDIVIETLTLDFSGCAMVEWLKRPKDADCSNIDREKHLNQSQTLYSRGNHSSRDMVVSAGRHDYPFQIQLPYNLPSSFVGDHGSIKYRAKAILERPWQAGVVIEREFTVISIVDLNDTPHVMTPVDCHKAADTKAPCCSPVICPRDDFLMIWRLDRTGYVPGERIRINGEIHNEGITVIRKSAALLIQHVQYLDIWGHNIHEKQQVARLEKGPIRGGGHIGFWREEMEVPPLPPTGLSGSSLMNLWYTLKLRVIPSGFSKPLETSIEITIGTVPIARNVGGAIATLTVPHPVSQRGAQPSIVDDYNYFV